ncbi:MAG: putative Na+/H+ antiporter [Pseudobdellovibrionaceae bacterium]
MNTEIVPTLVDYVGTILFGLAVLHTFICSKLMHLSHQFDEGSVLQSVFHFLGEVEVVFGIWAAVFFVFLTFHLGPAQANQRIESLNFTEPLFVFVIMVMASSKPVLFFAKTGINKVSDFFYGVFKVHGTLADFFAVLVVGSLMGSLITEPAAMTVSALLLNSMIHSENKKLLYGMLAVLFVNVSIGGALTHFAAPPILMVVSKWQWDFLYVFDHFGLKSLFAVLVNSALFCFYFRKEIKRSCSPLERSGSNTHIPWVVVGAHLFFLTLVVVKAHYSHIFFGLFLFFLGLTTITKKYQSNLRFKESLLVAFFLGGIIVFGESQKWWLQPLLSQMTEGALFLGAIGLTAVTDNAALTYLGSQVEGLSENSKFSLVAGALAGGGLTIIANAPNAAGYSILQKKFGQNGLNPFYLFAAALMPTLVAAISYWFLPF